MSVLIRRAICLPFVVLFGHAIISMPLLFFVLPGMGFNFEEASTYARIIGWVGAAVALALYVRSWKKTQNASQTTPVASGALSPSVARFVWVSLIIIGGWFVWQMVKGGKEEQNRKMEPGYAAFETADALLNGKSNGLVHGNTSEARDLASQFAEHVKQARNVGISPGRSSPSLSVTGGEFLTYCLLTPNSCIFLVHVPELRKFAVDAKNFMGESAWLAAMNVTRSRQNTLKTVAVGVRGAFLYERVVSGRPPTIANAAPMRNTDIQDNTGCRAFLQSFFANLPR